MHLQGNSHAVNDWLCAFSYASFRAISIQKQAGSLQLHVVIDKKNL